MSTKNRKTWLHVEDTTPDTMNPLKGAPKSNLDVYHHEQGNIPQTRYQSTSTTSSWSTDTDDSAPSDSTTPSPTESQPPTVFSKDRKRHRNSPDSYQPKRTKFMQHQTTASFESDSDSCQEPDYKHNRLYATDSDFSPPHSKQYSSGFESYPDESSANYQPATNKRQLDSPEQTDPKRPNYWDPSPPHYQPATIKRELDSPEQTDPKRPNYWDSSPTHYQPSLGARTSESDLDSPSEPCSKYRAVEDSPTHYEPTTIKRELDSPEQTDPKRPNYWDLSPSHKQHESYCEEFSANYQTATIKRELDSPEQTDAKRPNYWDSPTHEQHESYPDEFTANYQPSLGVRTSESDLDSPSEPCSKYHAAEDSPTHYRPAFPSNSDLDSPSEPFHRSVVPSESDLDSPSEPYPKYRAMEDDDSSPTRYRPSMTFGDAKKMRDSSLESVSKPNSSLVMEYSSRKRKLDSSPASKQSNYSDFSQRMMASMGYKPGMGLGLHNTGITAPLEESTHKGRRGLGYDLDGLEKEDVQWELEEIDCDQKPVWLDPCDKPVLTEEEMEGWIYPSHRKATIADEKNFCDPSILNKILDSKSIFDMLGNKEFLDARQRANPYETIRGGIFQNRAAMKMANIDSVFEFMFTSPKKDDGSNLVGPNDILYFADICAGPGGFSEYVFWKKKLDAKGFGITLKEPDSGFNFKLDEFTAGPCEGFDPHYGVNGYDGNGDVTSAENLEAFYEYVLDNTDQEGVHFAMADGGISVEGQENIQEILTKRLVLCQYLFALYILRTGGHFVCKVFDMFTPFSVGLFYLLYRSFKRVCIFKPVTSRPANSERYVVCESLRSDIDGIRQYLWFVNDQLKQLENTEKDVIKVVPNHLLIEQPFYSYISQSNDSIGFNQIIALKKLRYYVKNSTLQDTRQSSVRLKCLNLWKVPTQPRQALPEIKPKEIFTEAWESQFTHGQPIETTDCLNTAKFEVVTDKIMPFIDDIHSWKWCFACGKRYIIVGLGRNQIMKWDCQGNLSFSPSHEFNLCELPRGTILEAELVSEMTGEDLGQKSKSFLYIMDVLCVHGNCEIINKPFKERLQMAEKLCKILNKPCRRGYLHLRVKPYARLNEIFQEFKKLQLRKCKGIGNRLTWNTSEDHFIAPVGVIFCRVLKDPWQFHISTKYGRMYFFDRKANKSTFDAPPGSVANYVTVVRSRHIWMWTPEVMRDILCEPPHDTDSKDVITWTKLRTRLEEAIRHPK